MLCTFHLCALFFKNISFTNNYIQRKDERVLVFHQSLPYFDIALLCRLSLESHFQE